ncbi:class II aldolase/adducin family protein [Dongia soli]|uniref:Class II aldolase/adducin family protein n=1 Tax=Dongia soli TaxID=600628 RepID=A0ABU5E5I9_9PROT|nr:class II aldolase/adducin family protein [Dongia soli]MDY0881547.1 class II aldolase/adducin family protein [Dongia soli]
MSLAVIADNNTSDADLESRGRIDLAAAFRWFARLNMHESVANHLSFAVSPAGDRFLMNPRSKHFARMKASDLLLLATNDKDALSRPDAPDPTAWYIHGRLHAKLPQARCVMHLHSKYATALACLEDNRLYPIDQNTMRFYDDIAYDNAFGGMALSDDEGDRLASVIGTKSVLVMGNHGVLVVGKTVAQAFDALYYFERAAETLLTCYATGKKLQIVSENVAILTARQWSDYTQLSEDHLREVKAILDVEEPEYRS